MNAVRYRLWMLLIVITSVFSTPLQAQDDTHTVAYDNIRFSFPSSLATGIQIEMIDAIPYTDGKMFAETYPEHVRFSFLNYLDGSEFRLPYPIAKPQILVYSAESIRAFGYEFSQQFDALDTLLNERPELSAYVGASVRLPEIRLPFLPWVNSAQVLRSHPQYVEIVGVGSGIRYLTHYSQDAAHITDQQIFYTFQGIMDGGAYYVSAIFPVKTGVLPENFPNDDIDWDDFAANYDTYLAAAFAQIDNLADVAINPGLNTLDALIQSITFELDGALPATGS